MTGQVFRLQPGNSLDRRWRAGRSLSGQIHRLMEFWSTPGFCNERMTCYVVSDAQLGESALDEGEFLEVVTVSAQEGLAMALDGRLADAKSVAAVLAGARFLGL